LKLTDEKKVYHVDIEGFVRRSMKEEDEKSIQEDLKNNPSSAF